MVENLTKEKALETGHYVTLGRLTNIFQIILSNDQKRELWMIYPNDEKYEAENQTMLDILKQLGLELTEEKISSSFWKKLRSAIANEKQIEEEKITVDEICERINAENKKKNARNISKKLVMELLAFEKGFVSTSEMEEKR